jgi:hypothetical protein
MNCAPRPRSSSRQQIKKGDASASPFLLAARFSNRASAIAETLNIAELLAFLFIVCAEKHLFASIY